MTYSTNKNSKNNAKIRREREAFERQSSILDAARHVFFTKGISKATMDDVASEAAVAKGTVYLYYASKEALVAALTLEGLNLLDRVLAEAFAEGEWISAEERLKRLSTAYLNFCQHEPNYFRLIMAYDRGGFRASVSPEIYEQVL
ncbi:MAG TPA: helix-turn-helix domain-containing protein, partial [Anaerolineales bacterium]|nr:helix-turn-helix domain-containing protein [Anaerolineales bacterium]